MDIKSELANAVKQLESLLIGEAKTAVEQMLPILTNMLIAYLEDKIKAQGSMTIEETQLYAAAKGYQRECKTGGPTVFRY